MTKRLEDKIALVAGSAAGMGRVHARFLPQHGASMTGSVVVVDGGHIAQ